MCVLHYDVLRPVFLAISGSNFIATLTLGGAGAHASYYHKANDTVLLNSIGFLLCLLLFTNVLVSVFITNIFIPQLQLGVEFEASTRMQETSVSFGYQLDVPKANLLFKGMASACMFTDF